MVRSVVWLVADCDLKPNFNYFFFTFRGRKPRTPKVQLDFPDEESESDGTHDSDEEHDEAWHLPSGFFFFFVSVRVQSPMFTRHRHNLPLYYFHS